MKKNIIVLSGKMLSGKSTVADYLTKDHNYYQIAFADKLKESLYTFLTTTHNMHLPHDIFYTQESKNNLLPIKFPGNLPSTPRGAMQWWGELMKSQLGNDFWIKQVIYVLKALNENTIIADARFIYEIEGILKDKHLQHYYNIYTIKIESTRSPANSHISETHFENYNDFNFILENSGSLDELYMKVEDILQKIKDR